MAKIYLPPKQKALDWNSVILVSLVLLGLGLVVLANLPQFNPMASLIIALAFLLAIPFFYILYQTNKARQIRYELGEESLKIVWGLNSLTIPLKQIEWAHRTDAFEDEMPLPHWHLPGAYLNLFDIKGMGKTRFVATDPGRMILIKADAHYVVVSPEEPLSFLAALTEQKSLAKMSDEVVTEQNFKHLYADLRQDKPLKGFGVAGLIVLVLLWLTAGLLVALKPTVTWVTTEVVRASQLFLLPIFGTFMWLMSLVTGFFMWTQGRSDKLMVYLLLGSSLVSCFILLVASLLMAL